MKPLNEFESLIQQAMGAATFTYPREVGLAFGGVDYNPFIRIEVHYNNPDLIGGVIDSSGMRIKFIDKLRKFDAAVMELGLEYTDKMAIPPVSQRNLSLEVNLLTATRISRVNWPFL